MIAPGDTQALPRIPVPGTAVATAFPTVALTLAPALAAEPEVGVEVVAEVVAEAERGQVAPQPVAPKPVAPKVVVAPDPVTAKPLAEVPTATERPEPPADVESHERIYEEAMATIAALASNWSSAVQRTTGKHRAAA